jgi:hypothetical protein
MSGNTGGVSSHILESGKELSDDEIKNIISNIGESDKKKIIALPKSILKSQAKNMFPEVSETSILKAIDIIKKGGN